MRRIARRDESKYFLSLTKSTKVPQKMIVGEFGHKEDKDFKFYIILNEKLVKSLRHREIVVTQASDGNNRKCGIAYITNNMLYKLQKNTFYVSALWHELGHYHNGDFDDERFPNDIAKLRKRLIQENKVMEQELKADEFACRRCGKSNMINFLKVAMKERRNLGDKNSELAIKEISLRIKHLTDYFPNRKA